MSQNDGTRKGDKISPDGVNVSLICREIRQQMHRVAIDYALHLRKQHGGQLNGHSILRIARGVMRSTYHSPRVMELAMYIIASEEAQADAEARAAHIKHISALIDRAYAAFIASTQKETLH